MQVEVVVEVEVEVGVVVEVEVGVEVEVEVTYHYIIDGRLPGMNEMILEARRNRYAGAIQKKKETRRCAWVLIGHDIDRITKPVTISISWYEPNARRDVDNIAAGVKFILDGLQEAGKLPNDSRKWVKGITHLFPDPDPKNPRIEVYIEEINR